MPVGDEVFAEVDGEKVRINQSVFQPLVTLE